MLQYIRCLSCPYPATVHVKPAGSWVWSGGRHTTRTDADFSAQAPSLLLIFNSAAVDRQTQIGMLCTNHTAALASLWHMQPGLTHLCHCWSWSCQNVGGWSAFLLRRSVPSLHWFHWWPSSPGVPRGCWCLCWAKHISATQKELKTDKMFCSLTLQHSVQR